MEIVLKAIQMKDKKSISHKLIIEQLQAKPNAKNSCRYNQQ
jgi:hypothetical protein